MRKTLPLFLALLLVLGYWYLHSHQSLVQPVITVPNITVSPAVLGQQTKTTDCVAQAAIQDKDCTPGAIFPSATKDQICVSGYSKSVRNVPAQEKDQVYIEYGILSHSTGQYEVDHMIPLELGGSNDIANLWPEAAEPRPGFHEKDLVENYLHQQICNGNISLQQAQQEISSNWLQIYNQLPK